MRVLKHRRNKKHHMEVDARVGIHNPIDVKMDWSGKWVWLCSAFFFFRAVVIWQAFAKRGVCIGRLQLFGMCI
jgi:hypothetical protein